MTDNSNRYFAIFFGSKTSGSFQRGRFSAEANSRISGWLT